MRRKIVNAKVTDVEKRRYPSKHYVYIVQVSWDDGSETVVFRRYSKFFDFQISLLESFPQEGGLKDPSKRIIPFLPGKILFGRSHVREVAIKRLKPIDEYCGALVKLPAHISNSEQVLDFFESKSEDLHPPKEENAKARKKEEQDINEISGPILLEQYRAVADYTRTQPKELTIAVGQQLEVIEKHENGWWFVSDEEGERGWVPGVYLEKRDGQTENLITKQAELGHGEKYITTSKFNGDKDEVSFGAGVLVEVLQKNLEGWWYISYQGKQGWAPASYLEKPAAAVLRQSSENKLSVDKRSSLNRRSFPGDSHNAVIPSVPTESSAKNVTPVVKNQKTHLQITKTNSNPWKADKEAVKQNISKPLINQVKPPPKKSTLNSNSSVFKPQKPPPLPPVSKADAEPVYEYVTCSSFSADIPHGISFEKDKKVKVMEKSPGDWWYISMDDKEGWAPASHVKKVFPKEKSKSPPARPKLPTGLKKTSPVKPPKQIRKPTDNTKEIKNKALSTVQLRKSPPAVRTSPKPVITSPKPSTTNGVSPKPDLVAKSANFDLRQVLNNSVANKNNAQTNKQIKPVKPPHKPITTSSKPTAKNVSTPNSFLAQKKPVSPPPVTNGLKKPAITSKKPSTQTLGNSNGQIDFRSVLKPTAGSGRANLFKKDDNSNVKRPVVPGKPMLPTKPGKTPNGGKASAVAANKEKFENHSKPKPVGKLPKPVFLQLQQNGISNQNRNNNNVEPPKPSTYVVNRVEVSVPSQSFYTCRGAPDGQVDNIVTSDLKSDNLNTSATSKDERKTNLTYVAASNFNPENDNEMGFLRGDIATLLQKSKNDWWFVEINAREGWVPSNYFQKREESIATANEPTITKENVKSHPSSGWQLHQPQLDIEDEPLYSEIYENASHCEVEHCDDLFCAVFDFTASDDSTLSVGKGDTVRVLKRTDEWCFVRIVSSVTNYVDEEGWLPSHHLEKF